MCVCTCVCVCVCVCVFCVSSSSGNPYTCFLRGCARRYSTHQMSCTGVFDGYDHRYSEEIDEADSIRASSFFPSFPCVCLFPFGFLGFRNSILFLVRTNDWVLYPSSYTVPLWPWWMRPLSVSVNRVIYTHLQVSVVSTGTWPMGDRNCFVRSSYYFPHHWMTYRPSSRTSEWDTNTGRTI